MKQKSPLFRWNWSEQDGAFSARLGALTFLCEEPDECRAEETAEAIAFEYRSRLPALLSCMRVERPAPFAEQSPKELAAALGSPVIDLDFGIIRYPEQTLDTGSLLGVEFEGILEELSPLRQDG